MELKKLFESLPKMQSKRVAVMVGRMQPPTSAHYKIIDKMKEFIRKHHELNLETKPVIVIVEGKKSSLDKERNPLTAEERISFMEASGKANGCIFLVADNAFSALAIVRDNGFEPIAIGAGSDRAQMYIDSLDDYFKDKSGNKIKHYIIPGLERDDDAELTNKDDKNLATNKSIKKLRKDGDLEDDEISGSVARRAVELGYEEEFANITGLSDKPALAKKLFNKLKKAFGES